MDTTDDPAQSDPATPLSRWKLATLGDSEALRELARSYWYCTYAWWRRAGLDPGRAATAILACFTRWLTESPPRAPDSGSGRMREWLPARLAELAARGVKLNGEPAIAIEPEWAEERFAEEPDGEPDVIFQRRWALTVLDFTMRAVRAEYEERGQAALFAEVSPFAGLEGGDGDDERYSTTASRTGLSVGATRKAVFDFRTRHRQLLRAYVGDTVADPADLDSEMNALLCACDMPGEAAAAAPLPTAIRKFKPDELLARAMHSVRMASGAAGRWTPPSDEEIARLFPQYEMLGMLGRGGMGAVYRARQIALDRLVAIKLLPLEVSVDQDFADRFVREARAMARLNHPHIITVYDFGTTSEGHLYFVMEFVEGANLATMIYGPGLVPHQALAITGQVCTALAYAHGKGVVHRDIKPANVMVDTEGTAKVADFGLARLTDGGAENMGYTQTGMVMGTPDYMAPEQKRGMAVDHRADIFSVGVMLYEMLCRETPQGIFEPPSQRVGCDARLDQIVIKAMNRTPEGRFQSTTEMKAALDAALTPLPAKPQSNAPSAQPATPKALRTPRSVMKTILPKGPAKKSQLALYGMIAAGIMATIAIAWAARSRPASAPPPETAQNPPAPDPIAPTEPPPPFRPLFNGSTLAGWKYLGGQGPPPGWHTAESAIVGGEHSCIYVNEQFTDFELELDWRVSASGNGGIYYHVPTPTVGDYPHGSPEMQLAGPEQSNLSISGSLFRVVPATEDATYPTGLWNRARLVVQGSKAEHWINGRLVCQYDVADPKWPKIVEASKFGEAADFPKNKRGVIALQGWTTEVAYRNIRIRSLDPPTPTAKQTFDLLSITDPVRDRVVPGSYGNANTWQRRGRSLIYVSDGKAGKIAAPISIRARHYEVEIDFTRTSGSGRLHVDLPLGDGRILPVYVDAPGFKMINMKDGATWPAGTETRGRFVIRLALGSNGAADRVVILPAEGNPLEWTGKVDQFAQNGEKFPDFPNEPVTSLFSMSDGYEIRGWKVRVFEGEAKLLDRAKAPSASPAPGADGNPP